MKKLLAGTMAAFLTAATVVPVSALSISCPGYGGWRSMFYSSETGLTTWQMKDGSVIVQDADGTVIQSTQKPLEQAEKEAQEVEAVTKTYPPARKKVIGLGLSPEACSPLLEQKIFDLTNVEREKEGLPKLVWSKGLTEYAQTRAKEISQFFSHIRPNNEQKQGGMENIRSGALPYVYRDGQKQTATLDEIAQAAVDGWMRSDGHRSAIMKYEVDNSGDVWGAQSLAVGCYVDENGKIWTVQVFNSSISDVSTTVFSDLAEPIYATPMLKGEELDKYLESVEKEQ